MSKSPMPQHDSASELPQLVQRAQAGDNAAFDTLIQRFRAFAVSYALGRLSEPGLAQDAVQEAFLEAWVCLPRLRHPAAFPAFLRRILLKRCDRLTRGKHSANVSLEAVVEASAGDTDPMERVEAIHTRRVIWEALETLSVQDCTALLLHYAEGASQEEVAAFQGVTVATIKSRLHRARHRLREEITRMEETVRELLTAYQNQVHQQARAQGPEPDIQLLERARRKFDRQLRERSPLAPLETFTVRLGVSLLNQHRDHTALATLLESYLTPSLAPEEALWARWHYTRALSYAQRHADAVRAHRELRLFYAALSRPPGLGRLPLYAPEATPKMTPEELTLWVLMPMNGIADVALAWATQGVGAEWRAWAEEALAQTPATEESQRLRFYIRQTLGLVAMHSSGGNIAGVLQEKAALMERFRQEAHREGDTKKATHWEIERERTLLNQARLEGNEAEMRVIGERMIALVRDLPPKDHLRWTAGGGLIFAGLFDLALPVVRPYVEAARTDWPHLVEYALCLWKVENNIPAAAAVLREARAVRQRALSGQTEIERMPIWKMYRMSEVPELKAAVR